MAAKPGSIGWVDLTVPEAEKVRDFYREVVGWDFAGEPMGEYEDYSMTTAGDEQPVAGICHARGANAGIPPHWLIYIVVDNLDRRSARCVELGGKILVPARVAGGGRFCIIEDPAGAVCALYET